MYSNKRSSATFKRDDLIAKHRHISTLYKYNYHHKFPRKNPVNFNENRKNGSLYW